VESFDRGLLRKKAADLMRYVLFQEITMNAKLMKFLRDEDGITAIEYGLIAGLVAVALVIGVGFLTGSDDSTGLKGIFHGIGTKLTNLATSVGT
jgi:pilus assembly protein Flp/PilA